jgi:hypothetical protein
MWGSISTDAQKQKGAAKRDLAAPMLELARDIGQLIGVIEPKLEAKQEQTLGSSGVLIGQQAKIVEKTF